jgi:hypothetical protein
MIGDSYKLDHWKQYPDGGSVSRHERTPQESNQARRDMLEALGFTVVAERLPVSPEGGLKVPHLTITAPSGESLKMNGTTFGILYARAEYFVEREVAKAEKREKFA